MNQRDSQAPVDPPEGFVRHARRSPATAAWEPIWARPAEQGLQLAVRIREVHCNSRGFLHGGVIATLADNAMGLSVGGMGPFTSAVTVNLNIDYVHGARLGQWLQVEPKVVKVGSKLAFVEGHVTADGQVIARCNATFHLVA